MTPVPAPAPRRRPAPPASRRPGLRLVDPPRRGAAARLKRSRAVGVVAALVACALVFSLAGFHAMLLSGQVELDELNQAVDEEQSRYESLRLEVATLESPERIVAAAQDQLGMQAPEEVTWLVPTVEIRDDDADDTTTGTRPSGQLQARQAPWSAVKPFLGGSR